MTVSLTGGLTGRIGVVSYALRPIGYWSQNSTYRLLDDVTRPDSAKNEAEWLDGLIDMPTRMGDASVGRVDPGESYVRIDWGFLGVGASTAAQVWGPVRINPLLISAYAGGFPHAFVETARSVPVGIGRVQARWIVGRLVASPSAPLHAGTSTRTLVGAVGVLEPRGLRGLELGVGRVFHLYESSISYDLESILQPFSELLKDRVRFVSDPRRESNQLASVFFRIAPQQSPVEVYGEYLRDDHNGNFRDFASEPDHDGSYVLGLRAQRSRQPDATRVTLERVNARISHLDRVRLQRPPYVHSPILEGHTLRGLLLGSPNAIGGGGLTLRVERGPWQDAWRFDASVIGLAQDREGGTWRGRRSGQYTIAIGRDLARRQRLWSALVALQPAYGAVQSSNLYLRMAVSGR